MYLVFRRSQTKDGWSFRPVQAHFNTRARFVNGMKVNKSKSGLRVAWLGTDVIEPWCSSFIMWSASTLIGTKIVAPVFDYTSTRTCGLITLLGHSPSLPFSSTYGHPGGRLPILTLDDRQQQDAPFYVISLSFDATHVPTPGGRCGPTLRNKCSRHGPPLARNCCPG